MGELARRPTPIAVNRYFYKRFSACCPCGQGETLLHLGPMRDPLAVTSLPGYCAYCGTPLVLQHGEMPRRTPQPDGGMD